MGPGVDLGSTSEIAVDRRRMVRKIVRLRASSIARAIGQTFFVNDARTGLAFMAVAAASSLFAGVLAVLGAILAEAVGRALTVSKPLN